MKRNIIKILGIYLSLFFYCCTNNIYKENIFVSYLTGPVDTSVPYSIDNFKNIYKMDCDTIIIPEKDFLDIKNVILNHHLDLMNHLCDERIYVQYDSIEVCFGDIVCPMYNNEHLDSIVYKVKTLTSYYNYFSIEDLKEDPYVKKYGIPEKYNYAKEKEGFPRREYANIVLLPQCYSQ